MDPPRPDTRFAGVAQKNPPAREVCEPGVERATEPAIHHRISALSANIPKKMPPRLRPNRREDVRSLMAEQRAT